MRPIRTFLCILLALLWAGTAQAHFLAGSQAREMHLLPGETGETRETGAELVLRFPSTFAYAAALAGAPAGSTVEAPFLLHEIVAGTPYYRVNLDAALADPDGFRGFVLKDFRFSSEGAALTPEVLDLAVTKGAAGAGLESAEAALAGPDDASGYIADTDILLRLALPGLEASAPLTIEIVTPEITLPPTLLFDNHITDHRSSPPVFLSVEGFRPGPLTVEPRPGSTFGHFVVQGIEHILGGLDHVLFVLCLALAAPGLRGLIWSVTGFTIGHSVTLSAGVMGYVPQVPWFIPAVELGVALSIVAMGALVLVGRAGSMRFALAAGLGLLHGFGFAFMLAPMIGGGGLAVPLAGFNIGVEIGQLVLVSVIFTLLTVIDRKSLSAGRILRLTAASIAVLIALSMSVERTELTYTAFTEGA